MSASTTEGSRSSTQNLGGAGQDGAGQGRAEQGRAGQGGAGRGGAGWGGAGQGGAGQDRNGLGIREQMHERSWRRREENCNRAQVCGGSGQRRR